METLLARQSIIIKCDLMDSVMLGNYEFYYACGLLCRLAGKLPAQDMRPVQLYEFIEPLLDAYEPKDGREEYLLKMLRMYKVSADYDGQMPQLLQMGLQETHFRGK